RTRFPSGHRFPLGHHPLIGRRSAARRLTRHRRAAVSQLPAALSLPGPGRSQNGHTSASCKRSTRRREARDSGNTPDVSNAQIPFASLYRHGYVRIAAAVPVVRIGDPAVNANRTLALARQAADAGAALVVFPELGLSAYTSEDLFRQ